MLHEKVRLWPVMGPLSRSACQPALSSMAASTTSVHMSDIVMNVRLALACHGLSIKSLLDGVPLLPASPNESPSGPSPDDRDAWLPSCRDSTSFSRHSAASARARSASMRRISSFSRFSRSSSSCACSQRAHCVCTVQRCNKDKKLRRQQRTRSRSGMLKSATESPVTRRRDCSTAPCERNIGEATTTPLSLHELSRDNCYCVVEGRVRTCRTARRRGCLRGTPPATARPA